MTWQTAAWLFLVGVPILGISYLFIFEPEKPQEWCDFMFSDTMASYLMGTDILKTMASYPQGACIALGYID